MKPSVDGDMTKSVLLNLAGGNVTFESYFVKDSGSSVI